MGSVFSPWYAARRAQAADRRGADPFAHCAINVALYGPTRRWVMTERPAPWPSAARRPDSWTLGRSRIAWQGGELVVDIDERTSPFGLRLRGRVRLQPELHVAQPLPLDDAGRHHWWPVAPRSRAVVELDQPQLRFEGEAYHDANWGSEPLEQAFRSWTWSRAWRPDGSVAMLYDTVSRQGVPTRRGLRVDADGAHAYDPPHPVSLRPTLWKVGRSTRASRPGGARVVRTLEDTPFYNRSLVRTEVDGATALAVHESLDLDRFTTPWVQQLLPWRCRREPE